MAPPKISIITPVKNGVDTIDRAIKSVLSQTMTDFELLVIDDKSTDATRQVIGRYMDRRINYLSLTNATGANAARNLGVNHARADVVTFLDADDELLPHALMTRLDAISDEGRIGYVLTSYEARKKFGTVSRRNVGEWSSGQDVVRALLNYSLHIGGSSITTQKRTLIDIGGWNNNLHRLQDRDILLRLANHANGRILSQIDYVKYDRMGSISSGNESYISLFGEFVSANWSITSQHRMLIGRRVATRILKNATQGNFKQARADYLENLRQPTLNFSFFELVKHFSAIS